MSERLIELQNLQNGGEFEKVVPFFAEQVESRGLKIDFSQDSTSNTANIVNTLNGSISEFVGIGTTLTSRLNTNAANKTTSPQTDQNQQLINEQLQRFLDDLVTQTQQLIKDGEQFTELSAELKRVKTELEENQKRSDSLNSSNEQLSDELNRLKDQVASLKRERDNFKSNLDSCALEGNKNQKSLNAQRLVQERNNETIQNLERQVKRLNNELKQVESQKENAKNKSKASERQIKNLSKDVESKNKRIDELSKRVSELNINFNNLERECAQLDEEIEQKETQVNNLNNQVDKLKRDLDVEKKKVNELEKAKEPGQSINDNEVIKQYEEQINELEQLLEQCRKDCDENRKEKEDKEEEVDDLKEELNKVKAQKADADNDRKKLQDKVGQLEAKNDQLEDDNDELEDKLEEAEEEPFDPKVEDPWDAERISDTVCIKLNDCPPDKKGDVIKSIRYNIDTPNSINLKINNEDEDIKELYIALNDNKNDKPVVYRFTTKDNQIPQADEIDVKIEASNFNRIFFPGFNIDMDLDLTEFEPATAFNNNSESPTIKVTKVNTSGKAVSESKAPATPEWNYDRSVSTTPIQPPTLERVEPPRRTVEPAQPGITSELKFVSLTGPFIRNNGEYLEIEFQSPKIGSNKLKEVGIELSQQGRGGSVSVCGNDTDVLLAGLALGKGLNESIAITLNIYAYDATDDTFSENDTEILYNVESADDITDTLEINVYLCAESNITSFSPNSSYTVVLTGTDTSGKIFQERISTSTPRTLTRTDVGSTGTKRTIQFPGFN